VQAHGNVLRLHPAIPPTLSLLLDRLQGVRRYGRGWVARCPAHSDRTASLSLAAGEDERILIHCFAGCSVQAIVGAIGLTVGDLFPRRLADASPEHRRQLRDHARLANIRAAAACLDLEAAIVLIAASDVAAGRALPDHDLDRLAIAAERVRAARVALEACR
jgi:hypothetical protein